MQSSKFLLLVLACSIAVSDVISLSTKLGNVEGLSTRIRKRIVHKFLGIPYAKPPVGGLRFAKPQPHGPFSGGHLNATSFGSVCAQLSARGPIGSEDCLFLNVYTPAKFRYSNKKSVLIWIHGGSFVRRSSNEKPADILVAREDVVVVTINYRLNVFGFLSTQDASLPGNYALWDHRLAIQWVKDNIEDYGGNPNSITLFGESAGAIMVSSQMISSHNDASLFQRGITESGSIMSLKIITKNPLPTANAVISRAGCKDQTDVKACLMSKATFELLATTFSAGSFLEFYPNVDKDFFSVKLLVELASFANKRFSPKPTLSFGNFEKYDLLSGWNDQEGLLYMGALKKINEQATGKNLSEGISAAVLTDALLLVSGTSLTNPVNRLAWNIVVHYFMNSPFKLNSNGRSENDRRIEVFAKIVGAAIFKLPTIQQLQIHSVISKHTNTFAYEFKHKRRFQGEWYEGPDWLRSGADHSDEIPYIFGFPLLSAKLCGKVFPGEKCQRYTWSEKNLSRKMMRHWANFAKHGNPGWPFVQFEYPRQQKYIQLRTGRLGRRRYPLHDIQRLDSALTLIYPWFAQLQSAAAATATAAG